ncbi:MAG TPA: ABC transporter substrate-binding protein [Stellaceae bacterium]|nr:ABC transporter substrate-binding protein [Stellaceae bacterium]
MHSIYWRSGGLGLHPRPWCRLRSRRDRYAVPCGKRAASVTRRVLITGVLALASLTTSAGNGKAATTGPAATIAGFYDALLGIMKEGRRIPFDQRYAQLQPAVARAFDLALMTRIAIGPDWARLNPAQQRRLEAAFARYTIATYANRFDGYSGERFTVDPSPVATANGALVRTHLIPADGQPVSLDYLMRQTARSSWQVIDVYLNGTISELATRRAEFTAVLDKQGAEGLVRMLDQRAAALRTG